MLNSDTKGHLSFQIIPVATNGNKVYTYVWIIGLEIVFHQVESRTHYPTILYCISSEINICIYNWLNVGKGTKFQVWPAIESNNKK